MDVPSAPSEGASPHRRSAEASRRLHAEPPDHLYPPAPPGAFGKEETPPPESPAEETEGEGFFGNPSMRRLATAQIVASLGDWTGIIALLAVADRLTRGSAFEAFGTGFVLMSRMVPGLLLAPAAGVIVDRVDRRKLMMGCDVGRGLLLLTIPLVTRLWVLMVISLLLEAAQLLWVASKEASVPNLVHGRYLQRANSVSLIAAYGTFPVGAAIFAALAKVAALLGGISFLQSLKVNQESLAFFLQAGAFFTSSYLISGLKLPGGPSSALVEQARFSETWRQLKDGVRYIHGNRPVRTVMVGLGTALLGVGAVVSLGPIFVRELLAGGAAGFGLILFSMGLGAAVGILLANTVGNRLPSVLIFTGSCALAGASLFLAASMSSLAPGALFVGLVGFFGAPGYSSGFTVMHQNVDDEVRGRVFGSLLTVIRICMVFSLGLSPVFAGLVDKLIRGIFPDAVIDVGPLSLNVAGVRITLWLAGLLISGAGLWAGRHLWVNQRVRSSRAGRRHSGRAARGHPA